VRPCPCQGRTGRPIGGRKILLRAQLPRPQYYRRLSSGNPKPLK
jgi:hypothetical protein